MIRRILGWLRHTGDPVVEQSAPPEPSPDLHAVTRGLVVSSQMLLREALAEVDAQLRMTGSIERRVYDPLLDVRLKLRPQPLVRSSVPLVPGRTT